MVELVETTGPGGFRPPRLVVELVETTAPDDDQASDSEMTACPPNPLRIAAIAFIAWSSS